jgi:capsular polysaccharide export protein
MAEPPLDEGQARTPRRLFYYNAGFLRDRRLRRILALAGHDLRIGWPRAGDGVAVWGRSPYAARGEAVARTRKLPLVRIEDAFLRSVRPGRQGQSPLGLLIDPIGVHFDSAGPSALEDILKNHPLDDTTLMRRAVDGIGRLQAGDLSKYNIHDPALPVPPPGFVLVVDQTRDDASIRYGGATARTFNDMLAIALAENPDARVLIKAHPETITGFRAGHFGGADAAGRTSLITDAVSPHALLKRAAAVYTVSSQLGFEAILAGHRPRVFGQPFYAGWGLSVDENPPPRRGRNLTKAQLFAAAMILAPVWYDPCRDRLCTFEEAVDQLEAEVRQYREDRQGYVALHMAAWKRGQLQAFFGREKPLVFAGDTDQAAAQAKAQATTKGRRLMVWASRAPQSLDAPDVHRVEDGFLRSRGLGAQLVPPISLVADDLGIYYDPTRPSTFERLLLAGMPPGGRERARQLIEKLVVGRVTKYNQGGAALPRLSLPPRLPLAPRILVVGQVEDDASIRLGATGPVKTNLALLQAARTANPTATLIYKPHPDVEAGLRKGSVSPADLADLADLVARMMDPARLLDQVDGVWTITSLLGFEAMLRGLPVTCLGAPFYAGWGLTRDLAPTPQRRRLAPDGRPLPRPDLLALAHAALIAYPRYYDPVARRPCPPEVAVHRLIHAPLPPAGPLPRFLSGAQTILGRHAPALRR